MRTKWRIFCTEIDSIEIQFCHFSAEFPRPLKKRLLILYNKLCKGKSYITKLKHFPTYFL